MSRERIIVIAALVVLVAVVTAAWWFEDRTATSPGVGTSAVAGGPATGTVGAASYRVKVTRDGRQLATFDLAQLEAIGMVRVTLQGQPQEGPRLVDVLARAGVSTFATLTITGEGVRDSGRLEIARADVGADTVLAVAKRGTVKIAGPRIAYDQRVRDVLVIDVR